MAPGEQEIISFVREHEEEALQFLEKVVNINSGTMNHEGVRRVGELFRQEFDALGFHTKWIEMPDSIHRAGHLFVRRKGNQGKCILLIGHLDTVFEKDSPFQTFVREDSIVRGPGVNDMKGGDVAILFALKALYQAGTLKNTSIIVAFTGDEEKVGKPISVSRADLIDAAKKCDVALGFETGIKGYATVARRGSSGWRLEVSGVEGHSSRIFSDKYGSGAIFEAARILNAFHEKLRGEKYPTFNPGIILGGSEVFYNPEENRGNAFGKSNVIAKKAIVNGGLRFISNQQKMEARKKMKRIVSTGNLSKTSAIISFRDGYPAMPPVEGNYQLLKMYDRISRELGYEEIHAYDPALRGAADISFAAPYISSCLAGLGVTGSGAHTSGETMDIKSLSETTQRAALLIYRLTR
ncbi:MAG: M20/M25/M40 family metallo-hydrolase [Calditrichia bacterium]